MVKRKIAVVTGARAEYGILKPLLKRISESGELELSLIVTGLHLLKKYGLTINEIKKDSFKIKAVVEMYGQDEEGIDYLGKGLSKGIKGFVFALSKIKPDILVVLGDRLEPLAATLAAATLRIPIAHIHGGDKTDSGHIDECIRHSITRFAHIHFPAVDEHAKRLIRTGEEPWRIFKTGALGLDSIAGQKFIPKKEIFLKLGLNLSQRAIVCIFHPVHLENETVGKQMREIMQALKELKIQTVVIYPNNDSGSRAIIEEIEKYRKLPFVKIFPSLSHPEYISLLKYADALIGNSSSGIIEAPLLKLAVVNIGSRNTGRKYAENVIFTEAEKDKVKKAVKKALYDSRFKKRLKRCRSVYGEGHAAAEIIKVLRKVEINKKLLEKKITV